MKLNIVSQKEDTKEFMISSFLSFYYDIKGNSTAEKTNTGFCFQLEDKRVSVVKMKNLEKGTETFTILERENGTERIVFRIEEE